MNRYLKADDRSRKQMIELVQAHVKLPVQSIETFLHHLRDGLRLVNRLYLSTFDNLKIEMLT